tara:strand:- start:1318 stop:2985 length:1668 start_codon:yes stop_codon:yes gene_type:complete
MDLANEAKLISENIFYTKGLANSLIVIGKIYQNLSNYGEAMKAALQAMELFKGLKDVLGESVSLDILGGVYNFLGDFNKRLDCNLKCLALREKANDLPAQLSTTNNIGDTYMSMGDYDNALLYFEKCLLFSELDARTKAIVYYNIGEVYFHINDYKAAKENIDRGLKNGLDSGYWQIVIAAYQIEAKMLIKEEEFNAAISLLEKAKMLAIDKDSFEDEYSLERNFSDAYGGLKQFEKAYECLSKHELLKEELLSDNNAQKLKKIEFEFQFKNIKSEAEETKEKNKLLTRAFNQIENQRNEIESKNQSITDSIKYAKRIQDSIFPSEEKIEELLEDSFVFYQPKDIVSGDFYWIDSVGDEVIFSVIDCTGHGVPGAFVSLIAYNALNKVILEKEVTQPSKILIEVNRIMIESFGNTEDSLRDGMDMGVCSWNRKTNTLQFAGACHSIFIHDGELFSEVKGDRESIGSSFMDNEPKFTNHVISVKPKSMFYLSSDGFPDQFGGEKGKKLKWKGFKNVLENLYTTPIYAQQPVLKSFFENWRGDLEQLDDICVVGVKL